MNVQKKMALIVSSSILLTAVPGAMLIYDFAKRNTLETEILTIKKVTAGVGASAMQRFAQGEPKLRSFAHLLGRELQKPPSPAELQEYQDTLELNPDGVWRNRRKGFDGLNEAGVFLPDAAQKSDEQKIWHLRIKKVMDTFGASASRPLENIWYLSNLRSEIIFDRTFPMFAFDQKADNDYTSTPWVTLTTPASNPERQFRFTPPLYDPVPKVWMVSAIYPLYAGNRWIGSVGEDMQLTSVLESIFTSGQLFAGTQHFLLDDKGDYILAGPWQHELESSTVPFKPDLSGMPELQNTLGSPLPALPAQIGERVHIHGTSYIAIGMRLEPVGWRYFRLTRVDEILAPTRQLFFALFAMILIVTGLTGMLIGTAAGASITRRIKLLSDSMKRYASDHTQRVENKIKGNDEIAELGRVFDHMAEDISSNISERNRVETALKESEEVWRYALEGAGDGVWDWNISNGVVIFSTRWKEMLGYREEEISDDFSEFTHRIHPDDYPDVMQKVRDYFEGKTPTYAVEMRMQTKEAGYKWILSRGMVVSRDEQGAAIRMVGTHSDLTARKTLEQALIQDEEDLNAIFSHIPDGVVVFDNRKRISHVNRAFADMAGLSADAILGIEESEFDRLMQKSCAKNSNYPATSAIPPVIGDRITSASTKANEPFEDQIEFDHPQQRILLRSRIALEGPRLSSVLYFRDISAETLVDRMKSDFLATAAHELRTPMTIIRGYSELLAHEKFDPHIEIDLLEKINAQSESVTLILDELLDLARIEARAGKAFNMEIVSIREVIKDVADSFIFVKDPRRVSLIPLPELPDLLIDREKIVQVLKNCLSNAFKYSTVDTPVELEAGVTETPEIRAVVITIRDRGIGMTPEQRSRIFEKFYRADTSGAIPGTGLGMSLVKEIIEYHHGQVVVTSELGKGTEVSLFLPMPEPTN